MDTLRNYTFLPWLRQGVASEISVTDDLERAPSVPSPERADVTVSFKVNGQPVSRHVNLLGPGDVIGINPRVIVKTEPRNFVTDFEANYLSYIEFYEEDFPWRFTPVKAAGAIEQSRLRPWIFLIVLAEDEFDDQKAGGPLPAFEIKEGLDLNQLFPRNDQSWAWAHVHVGQNVIGNKLQTTNDQEARTVEQNLQGLLATNSDNASSRLLCPRKLRENTAYHAFVIPGFETGRLAGLGLPIPPGADGQKASWGDGQTLYPIYYRWPFRTGTKGDFEFLVDLLEPRRVDKRTGVRDMDLQSPGYEVDGMSGAFKVMGLEGALKSPETESIPAEWPPQNTDFDNPPPRSPGSFLNQLTEKVNLQFALQQEETSENPHPDPIISPPLYGKWYAMAEQLQVKNGTGWVNQLNRDPRFRAPAGVGTQVIQKDQERFMQQAWSQLGDLLQTNQKIRQFQLGWMTSNALYRKNVLPQLSDKQLAFTQPVHSRILASPVTIARQVTESRLPQAAMDPAFRKIARSRGAIMRKVAPEVESRTRPILSQINSGDLTAAEPPPDPTGQISLDKTADTIDPVWVPDWLRRLLRDNVARWVLVGLLILAVLLMFVTGLFIVFGILVVVLAGVLVASERLRNQIETAEAFHESAFTPRRVDEIPPRPNFVLTEFDAQMPPLQGGGNADSVEAANFRVALKDAFNVYQSPPPPPPVRNPLDISHAVVRLQQSLNPAVAIPKRAEFVLKIPVKIKDSYLRPQKTLVPVMAHPVFPDPMYRPLRDISSELLVPNLDLIPNNTISLMVTNEPFIESYMMGLNHEMGSELLWREFPTDQRGSYFRQFWDVGDLVNRDLGKIPAQAEEELLDITKLHTWDPDSNLGAHENRPLPTGAEPGEARLVLVVRGDLLKKYPTAVIYAQQARWGKDPQGHDIRELDDSNPDQNIKNPIFKAEIDPDIRFLGFELTKTVAKGNPDPAANDPGWYFVIQERPGEPRFGLDNFSDDSPETASNWNQLAWEHLENFAELGYIDFSKEIKATITDPTDSQFQWGRNAADMAYIMYQVPVMVAFHAADMLA
jgi:hypothetical protein